ncbi:hypothetical protein [Neobittarella massiliensis]|uniref:hypothetical protein n=1 Tax=Neobittarella massiliensis (ex Bilen et al. 2018) TaxID=2041842 RepID=UPI000CF67270|nr:hypothetical protein [Neobittarella massiliensis]
MKQIKTIVFRLDNRDNFDSMVNMAIAEGWKLKKRTVLVPKAQSDDRYTYIMLYAELERETEQ